MKSRTLVLLGSTGSIGRATLDVVRNHPGAFSVAALAAHTNADLLEKQYQEFRPRYLCLLDVPGARQLAGRLKGEPVEVLCGRDDLVRLSSLSGVDIVVNAVVGAAGLLASLEAVKEGRALALANKESLVAGGPLFAPLVEGGQGTILPIDSEHSAVWQLLACGKKDEIKRIIITASGGPFKDLPADEFQRITPAEALNHPTWKMGSKITIDSATLANKGLEIIEAVALFQVDVGKIDVVVHPQSIVHSLVEFMDSAMVAQLSKPDMRLPISYALFWPDRVTSSFGRLDLTRAGPLTFEEPDFGRFPMLKLAYEAAGTGGTAPALFNAANEVAVDAFLKQGIAFLRINEIVAEVLQEIPVVSQPQLDDILDADRKARELAQELSGKTVC